MELIELTERLIRAQEEERQRLARELHNRYWTAVVAVDHSARSHERGTTPGAPPTKGSVNGALEEASAFAPEAWRG